jgi:acetyl esterase/lipase
VWGTGFNRGGLAGATWVWVGSDSCTVHPYYSSDNRLVCYTAPHAEAETVTVRVHLVAPGFGGTSYATCAGACEALMLTMAHDPLCDEGLAYAKRLDQEGVRVTALHLNDQFHGLLGHGGAIPAGQVVTGFVADWLGHELHRAP